MLRGDYTIIQYLLHFTAGETLPTCSSLGFDDLNEIGTCYWDFNTPCSKGACGVGIAYNGIWCGGDRSDTCTVECCCKICSGNYSNFISGTIIIYL